MTIESRPAAVSAHPDTANVLDRLIRTVQRCIAGNSEGTVVFSILGAFVVVWMIFWTISAASVDVHVDADEALNWARHFAFGYKHPPMTGWLFIIWFSIFPHRQWAVDLLIVTTCAVALGVTWRLLRDHLDKNRALLGLIALILVPLYDIKAEVLNANTVMAPFWAAALLFYLRARRDLRVTDAFLAGAFASLTMLGKYWAVFLLAGMAVAVFVGPGTRRFWRSPVPYVMAAGAAIVIAPHVWWVLNDRASVQFAQSVAEHAPFGAVLGKTIFYVLGAVAYVAVPLVFLVGLWPGRAAVADIIWPTEEDRRQAWVLLLVPLILPALLNLVVPYRLTPDWTFPNWALLPVVLYGSRFLVVDDRAVARAGVFAMAAVLVILIATPVIACVRLTNGPDQYRPHFRQVAVLAQSMTGTPIQRFWGSASVIGGLPFYLPEAQRMVPDPLSEDGMAMTKAHGLLVVCLLDDAACLPTSDGLVKTGARTRDVALTRSFLGLSSPPLNVRITVAPPG
jgi:4-amino-4-deoxy-L-arabinose transferase-like glycosyltransferase